MQLWIFGICLIAYYALHSLLAANSIKQFLNTIIPSKVYRLFFNGTSLILLFGLIYFYRGLPIELLFEPLTRLGIVFLAIGGILLIGALAQYNLSEFAGWHQLNNKGEAPDHSLNKKGLNKYVRHPLYTANFFLFIGFLLYFPALKTLIVVGISSLYLIIGTKLEEHKLVEVFGNTYETYQKEVGQFFPKLF